MLTRMKNQLLGCLGVILAAGSAQAESVLSESRWALEAGSGLAFVYPHPQLKLWYQPTSRFELGLNYSPGINNYEVWSQTLMFQAKYRLEVLPGLSPFAMLSAGVSAFGLPEGLQGQPFAGLGLGCDWMFSEHVGLSGAMQLLAPDPYSRAPFVFRPELNLRWEF